MAKRVSQKGAGKLKRRSPLFFTCVKCGLSKKLPEELGYVHAKSDGKDRYVCRHCSPFQARKKSIAKK